MSEKKRKMSQAYNELFNNAYRIERFFNSVDSLIPLELEDPDGSVLFLMPLELDKSGTLYFLCFKDRKSAENCVKMDEEHVPGTPVNLSDELAKYHVNALLLCLTGNDSNLHASVQALSFGEFAKDKDLADSFFSFIMNFLSHEDLRVKYINQPELKGFDTLTNDKQDLCLNAISIYRLFQNDNQIFNYESSSTKRTGYFQLLVSDKLDDLGVLAAFKVFKSERDEEEIVTDLNDVISNDDLMIVFVTSDGKKYKWEAQPFGKMKELSEEERDEFANDFLKALRHITVAAMANM